MRSGGKRFISAAAACVLLALAATACQAQSTVTATERDQAAEAGQPEADQATADAVDTGDAGDDAQSTPTPTPVVDVVPSRPTQPVALGWFLGFSPDAAYGFDTNRSPYESQTPCGTASGAVISTVDLVASTDEQVVGFDSGIAVEGDPDQLELLEDGSGVLLATCGVYPDNEHELIPVQVDIDGSLVPRSETIRVIKAENERTIWFRGLVDADTVRFEVTIGADEDYDNWIREVRHVDLTTGEISVVSTPPFDDAQPAPAPPVTSPDGRFTYQVIDDPNGRAGCEGYGIAVTLQVDDGTGQRAVFGSDQPVYSSMDDLHFGPDDLVAWSSSCEGGATVYIGRVTDDGSIVDAHWLDTYSAARADETEWVEYRQFRLLDDGQIAAFGTSYDEELERSVAVYRRIDLSDDPNFVNTGDQRPWIDTSNPLAPTLAGTGEWFIGESLATAPGCGGRTLYASTTAGFVRGIDSRNEIDEVVDFAVGETRVVDYGDGFTFDTRALAVLTECADEYVGRQLWFASEPERPGQGLWFQQADLPALADLIGIREVQQPDSEYGFDMLAEVVYRDGSVEEVLLRAVPYDS